MHKLELYDCPEPLTIRRLSDAKIHITYYVGLYYIESESNEVFLVGFLKLQEIFKYNIDQANTIYYTNCKSSIPFMTRISCSFGIKRKRINYSISLKNIIFENSDISVNTKDSYVIQGSDIIGAYHRKRKIEKLLNN